MSISECLYGILRQGNSSRRIQKSAVVVVEGLVGVGELGINNSSNLECLAGKDIERLFEICNVFLCKKAGL